MPRRPPAPEPAPSDPADRADPLREYQKKRDFGATPEPAPKRAAKASTRRRAQRPRFVVQEHHARRLHWDLRLEHDGVLWSWAVPKGIPMLNKPNHLAVRTEDHPMEYLTFRGDIPKGQYGAGTMSIWDSGTYEAEKLRDDEVIVTLHGKKVDGKYALFQTKGNQWMIHRMSPPTDPTRGDMPRDLRPMLAVASDDVPRDDEHWAFEMKWDGMRALLAIDGGTMTVTTRQGNDATARFPELHPLAEALGSIAAVLDGEIVLLDDAGRPSFELLQPRMHVSSASVARRLADERPVVVMLFDVLWLDGHSTLELPYTDRRKLLDQLALSGPTWQTPPTTMGGGVAVLRAASDLGLEGIVAKRLDSTYLAGRRSDAWRKVKPAQGQELVVGGWLPGAGRLDGRLGSLLVGYYDDDDGTLQYAGRVGSGLDETARTRLEQLLAPLARATSPFANTPKLKLPTWVEPRVVVEVAFHEWTRTGVLRAPRYKGVRIDKDASEVVREIGQRTVRCGFMTDLAWMDAHDQAALVRDGDATPRELVDAAIARIEAVNPALNAVIHERFDRARAEAADPPAEPSGSPFRGVPIVVKDLDGGLAGEPFHWGNRLLKEIGHTETRDSHLIAKLRRAGFVIVGKTNCPEFGLLPTTEPTAYGPTRNPWSTDHSPGGSSGGTGAAVAAGMVPLGHAGDGGGSIRIPASTCGLFGLKPTRGRVSLGPDEGESWSGLVVRHVLTRSVRDSAAVLDVIAGAMPGDPYAAAPPARPFADEVGADPGVLRIGAVTAVPNGMAVVDPECAAAVDTIVALLETLGHSVEPVFPEALGDDRVIGPFLTLIDVAVGHDVALVARIAGREVTADDFEALTWSYAERSRALTTTDYVDALEAIRAWSRRVATWWSDDGFDLLLTPTIATLPAPIGAVQGEDVDGALLGALPYAVFTAPFNMTGQPAVSVPATWSTTGLPIGVQLVAATGREDVLLRVASQLEVAQPWAGRHPPVHA